MTPCKPLSLASQLAACTLQHERLLQILASLLSTSERQACASAHSVGPMSFD